MKNVRGCFYTLLLLCFIMLPGCANTAGQSPRTETEVREDAGPGNVSYREMQKTGDLSLAYATQYRVSFYGEGYSLITIGEEDEYLLVPEGGEVPEGVPENVKVIRSGSIYLASSSAMDFFRTLGAISSVRLCSTKEEDWRAKEVRKAMQSGDLLYAGKYSAPDFELILQEGVGLAIENTMIYHNPEIMEQIEALGIPVMVERSSYESHPLGRLEWIKLYGLLTGKEDAAEAFFEESIARINAVSEKESTGKTVAFFHIGSGRNAVVRKPGDYITKMIELAGGVYALDGAIEVNDNALSTMNMELESFYDAAKDADILVYNSTIAGELDSLEALFEKSELLRDFRAAKEGHVYCTDRDMFQMTCAAPDLIEDFHRIIEEEGTAEDLTLLYPLR